MDLIDNGRLGPTFGDRVIKVNHAGENGAIHIYTGQIAMAQLTAPSLLAELRDFRSHEMRHRLIFAEELSRRGVRRCRSYWLCGLGGLVLGLATGLFGRGAISATTAAVERVVLAHLKEQLSALGERDVHATTAIAKIVAEEQEHLVQSASHFDATAVWSRILSPIVAMATESVIWLGMRL